MTNILLSMAKRIVQIFLFGLLGMMGYIILAPIVLRIIGYYHNGIGWEVAKLIIERRGQAGDCKKIIHITPQLFAPSEGEQRASCVYEYAKLSKDPTACELLMPSRYGLDCVGVAQKN